MGGLPTSLVVLCAGVVPGTLLLFQKSQKWQLGFGSFCVMLFIICLICACLQLSLVPESFFLLLLEETFDLVQAWQQRVLGPGSQIPASLK